MSFFERLVGSRKQRSPPQDDWEAKLVWLPVGHASNPFQEEVLDCRPVALTFLSTTSDKSVAELFSRLRSSSGSEHRGRIPESPVVADCDLRFPYDGHHNEGPLFVAREMEDKWDFYAYDSRLYVCRSWTGHLTHVAELQYSQDAVIVRRVHCEPNTVFGERAFAVAQLRFLITTHMGRSVIPFPVLPDMPRRAARAIALMGFSAYGRRAQFASYIQAAGSAG